MNLIATQNPKSASHAAISGEYAGESISLDAMNSKHVALEVDAAYFRRRCTVAGGASIQLKLTSSMHLLQA
jgi:hypothetical protein